MSNCIFCQIAQKKAPATVRYEDDRLIAFDDAYPQADTHVLLIPKHHISTLQEASEKDSSWLGHLMVTIPTLATQFKLEGYRTIINTGEKGGQVVFHLHAHILAGVKRLPSFV